MELLQSLRVLGTLSGRSWLHGFSPCGQPIFDVDPFKGFK